MKNKQSFMNRIKCMNSVWGAIITLAFIISLALGANAYIAKQKDLTMLALNFEQYKVDQRIDSIQDRIWQVEDRIKKEGEKPELLERLRELRAEQERMKEKSKELRQEK